MKTLTTYYTAQHLATVSTKALKMYLIGSQSAAKWFSETREIHVRTAELIQAELDRRI